MVNERDDEASHRRRWQALSVCLLAGFMTLLDVSIVNIALPSIQVSLDAREADLQWVVSGYTLAFGLVLVTAGRIGDARGRRTVFIVGVVAFTLASMVAGLAPTAHLLIAARIVQGAAGGVINPQISGLIQQLFQGAERGRAFGLLGTTIGISTAIGPTLGGFLIFLGGPDHGWRWIFFVNVPVGALAVALAIRLIPKRRTAHSRERLDPVGVVLLGTAMLLLLLPLVETRELSRSVAAVLLVLGVAFLVAFLGWENRYARSGEPVVDPALFRRRSFRMGFLIAMLYFAGFTAIFFIFSLYLQEGLGYTAIQAGLALSPFAIGSAIAAAVGGRLVARLGRPLVAIGLLVVGGGVAAAMVTVTVVPSGSVGWATALPLLVAGLGSGLVVTPNITLTLSDVPVRQGGSAGGVLQTSQRLGAATGIAVVGSVFFSTVASSDEDWSLAYRYGLLMTLGFVLFSLIVTVLDVRAGRRSAT